MSKIMEMAKNDHSLDQLLLHSDSFQPSIQVADEDVLWDMIAHGVFG